MKQHCLAVLFAGAAATHAASVGSGPAAPTLDELKSAYLDCDRRAATAFLDAGDAANCSLVYEELKKRVFTGDFERLLAWWQAQRGVDMNARSRIAGERR
jgi:hypothetical protein